MAIKPLKDIKKKDKVEEEVSVPFMVYVKGFFLVAVVLVGMFLISTAARNQSSKKSQESLSDRLPTKEELAQTFSKDAIQKKIGDEIRTNETYRETVKTVQKQSDVVLGEASKAATTVIEESKEMVTDQIYEYTYGKIVEGMVNALPERQKELLLQRMCK